MISWKHIHIPFFSSLRSDSDSVFWRQHYVFGIRITKINATPNR